MFKITIKSDDHQLWIFQSEEKPIHNKNSNKLIYVSENKKQEFILSEDDIISIEEI